VYAYEEWHCNTENKPLVPMPVLHLLVHHQLISSTLQHVQKEIKNHSTFSSFFKDCSEYSCFLSCDPLFVFILFN
jgi:hypothetical protein